MTQQFEKDLTIVANLMAVGEAVKLAGLTEDPERAAPSLLESETAMETAQSTEETAGSSESNPWYRETGMSFENYQAALSECTRRVACC